MSAQYGELRLTSVYQFGAPQQISMGFTSCLLYCSDVAHWRPTKLCTVFGHLLRWHTIHFWGLLPPYGIFSQRKIHITYIKVLHSLTLAALLHGTPAAGVKLCGVVQGMELRNFGRRRHLYSAGRPSHWSSAHILFIMATLWNRAGHIFILWFFLCLLSLFPSPILSRHRLDVYHASTRGVALVRI